MAIIIEDGDSKRTTNRDWNRLLKAEKKRQRKAEKRLQGLTNAGEPVTIVTAQGTDELTFTP